MVGNVVGTAAYLSVVALIWVLLARSGWNVWAIAAGLLVFLVIGVFATFDPRDWERRPK